MNITHLERLRLLQEYIDKNIFESISIPDVEACSFYSYRNINRIFLAHRGETIGQHIRRRRLEKAAEYIKYSSYTITEIAEEVGYSDKAAFSKAFKQQFELSPSQFREKLPTQFSSPTPRPITTSAVCPEYEVIILDSYPVFFQDYHGSLSDGEAIERVWIQLHNEAYEKGLTQNQNIYWGLILDDPEITDELNCRFTLGLQLSDIPQNLPPYQVTHIPSGRYARFFHRGDHESSFKLYDQIFAAWPVHILLELDDKPIIEKTVMDENLNIRPGDAIEIYIPVL